MSAISTIGKTYPPKVYISDSLVGVYASDLVPSTNVFCDFVSQKTAPAMSQAVLSHKYGFIALNGASKFTSEPVLDLRGKFVRVSFPNSSEVYTDIFTGYIANQEDAPQGTYSAGDETIPTGNNIYRAYSLDFLLDRVYIDKTYSKDYGNVTAIIPFNGATSEFIKNRSQVRQGDSYIFEYSDYADLWTAYDIIEYLLLKFSAASGLEWDLAGKYESLANITMSLDPEGKTLRQCFNELIRPEYGFSYKVTIIDNLPHIDVFSIIETEIKIGNEIIIPANNQTATLGSEIESSRSFQNVRISQVEQSAYDYVRVFSEPVRVMATFKIGTSTGGLANDWDDTLETEYAGKADFERQDEKYEKLWSAWKFNGWNGKDCNQVALIPLVNEADCSVTYADAETNPIIYPAHTFDRKLPILKDNAKKDSDYKNPLFFIKSENGDYFIADKTITDDTEEHPSIGLSIMDDAPGIQVKPHLPHMLSKNSAIIADSEYAQLYDYSDCLFTGSIFTDSVLAYKMAGVETSGPAARTKNIYVPGFHYWVAAPGTRIDRNETTSVGIWTIYKDDREALKKFAALAKAWYGRIRNTVSYTSENVYAFDYLGYMVTQIYSGGSFTPVGTVISSIEYDFINYTLNISTDFADLDLQKISKRNISSSTKAVNARLAKIEEQLTGENVRLKSGGGGGFNYTGPFALKKTDATHVKVCGNSSSDANDIDSYLIIDVGTYCYAFHVNETTLEPSRTIQYICLDWWWNTVTGAWVHAVVASASLYPVAGEYGNYPVEMERVSRRILGKANFIWNRSDDTWILSGVTQWYYGAIYASTRAY